MSIETAFAQLKEANPVPRPEQLRSEAMDTTALLEALRQGSTDMQTTEERRGSTAPSSNRNGWLIGLAAAAAAVVIGVVAVLSALDSPPTPADVVPPDGFQHHEVVIPDDAVAYELTNEQLPFYARGPDSGSLGFHDEEWSVVYFYRPVDCIPADFDFKGFFDFPEGSDSGAFGCEPLLWSGSAWDTADWDPSQPPIWTDYTGDGDVPVWFIPADDFTSAVVSGPVTMEVLASLEPLKGTASVAHEVHRVNTGNISVSLSGLLDDGTRFDAFLSQVGQDQEVWIDLGS